MPVHRPESVSGCHLPPSIPRATPKEQQLPLQRGLEPLLEGLGGGDGAALFHLLALQHLAELCQRPPAKHVPSERVRHPSEGNSYSADDGLEIVSHQAFMDLSSPFLSLIIPPLGRYRFSAVGCLLVFRGPFLSL